MRLLQAPRVPSPVERGDTLIEARGVTVYLGGKRVLDSVDIAARAGELVALVGPNGAGKSTLLHVLSGDIEPVSGTVQVHGVALQSWTDRELALRRAVLPQDPSVTFPFLVDDIVRMGRAPWTRTAAQEHDDTVVEEALLEADIADLALRQFPSLSGGERARVCLARVLAQRTQLLLLDEPTASLDLHHQELTLEVVRAGVRDGKGAVVVLHDLSFAGAHADRIVMIAGGRVVADGPPGAVLTSDLLSSVYHHEVAVIPHPETGDALVLPRRPARLT
jgi:iron complex transport system ATP-binding protein